MSIHKAVFGLAAAFAVASPPAAFSFGERPVRSLLEARHQNVVIQEWDSSCGAAALATILRYQLGDPVTERSVALGMLRKTDADRVRIRGGFSLLDMKRYAETRGYVAEGYAGLRPGQLMRLAPAVVPISSHGGDHFVVFRGIVRGQAVLADPAFGNRNVPYPVFAAHWKDGLAFVVQKPGRKGNRLLATQRDLLRVEDEDARRSIDETLPRPLSDAQLALVSGAEPLPPADSSPIAGEPSPGSRAMPPRVEGPGGGGTSGASSPGTSTIAVALPPATSGSSISTGPVTINPPVVSASLPPVPPISVSIPPLPPVSITLPPPTAPAVNIGLGR